VSERNAALDWENTIVLMVVQAMLGLVAPGLRGVAVEIDGEVVTLHFAVARVDDELREDVDDIIGDVEGLLWPQTPEVRSRVTVGDAGPSWEGRQHRLVYLAKLAAS
jgi:hypothetical protein